MPRHGSSKLRPEYIEPLAENLRNGLDIDSSCRLVGVAPSTYYYWLREAEELSEQVHNDDGGRKSRAQLAEEGIVFKKRQRELLKFLETVKRAEAQAIQRNVLVIQAAVQNHWQAAAWYLERRRPGDWGKKDQMGVSGPDGGPIPIELVTTEGTKIDPFEMEGGGGTDGE